MPGPMDGIKVVELAVWIAGPAAGGILADWGADVIKIEPPQGDPSRGFREMFGAILPSNPVFELDNRSKRSIVLDLRDPAATEVALELIDEADVFISNLRLKSLQALGLDYDTVSARNERLVYLHVTGYGLDGPDVNRAAFDIAAFWSRAGIASLLSGPDGDPPFQRGGMGDHNAGLAGAGAVSAALFEREKSGKGQLVSTSLFREGMYTIGFDLNMMLMWGMPISYGTRKTMASPTTNNYIAGDGKRFWVVGLQGERHWPPLARVVGHPEWIEDERFATPRGRYENSEELIALLDDIFATKSLAEWAEVFDTEPDMFWAPINSLEDLLEDPQFEPSGGTVDVPDGTGSATMVATPVDFGRTTWAPRSVAPELGEHSREILAELGRSEREIAALTDDSST